MNVRHFFLLILIFPVLLSAQKVEVINFEDLQPELQKQDDTVRVINFWATWCVPCVQEMPGFVKASEKYQVRKVKFLYVSLDFPKDMEEQVLPFIEKYGMKGKVVLLDDPDANTWINKVDHSWSGAIPATLIYRADDRNFVEGSVGYDKLTGIIDELL